MSLHIAPCEYSRQNERNKVIVKCRFWFPGQMIVKFRQLIWLECRNIRIINGSIFTYRNQCRKSILRHDLVAFFAESDALTVLPAAPAADDDDEWLVQITTAVDDDDS